MNFAITGKKIGIAPQTLPKDITIMSKTQTKVQPKPAIKPKIAPRINSTTNNAPKAVKPKQPVVQKPPKQEEPPKPVIETVKVVEPQPVKVQEVVQVKAQEVIGQVVVRYNHYKQSFPTINSVLSFKPIQQKYCFADVFKGNYQPVLKKKTTLQQIEPLTTGTAVECSWAVEVGVQYKLQINEDQGQQAKYERKAYIGPKSQNPCGLKKNPRIQDLTQEMKSMGKEQYGTAKHRQLLEQRDLEDILFS